MQLDMDSYSKKPQRSRHLYQCLAPCFINRQEEEAEAEEEAEEPAVPAAEETRAFFFQLLT